MTAYGRKNRAMLFKNAIQIRVAGMEIKAQNLFFLRLYVEELAEKRRTLMFFCAFLPVPRGMGENKFCA